MMISFSEARLIAEKEAATILGLNPNKVSLLDDSAIEKPGCWIFSYRKNLAAQPHKMLELSAAFAVSKNGNLRLIAGDWENRESLDLYADSMSIFFIEMEK